MPGPVDLSNPISDQLAEALGRLEDGTLDLALALGLVRVLTCLPLFDESLAEVERRLVAAVAAVADARAALAECSVLVRRSALVGLDAGDDG